MATVRPPTSSNRLLNALSQSDYKEMLPHLEPVDLPFRKVLYPQSGRIDYVYFPSRGVVSTVVVMKNRQTIEVGICGSEGAIGATAAIWDANSTFEIQVQVAGNGMRMKIDKFRECSRAGSSIHRLMASYQAAYHIQVAQSVACNGLHSIVERCCRWLLMTQDRMQDEVFGLTHELLGVMLGVRRASITDVLRPLQARGLIKYARGVMTVRDRRRLEAASCECYKFVRSEFDRLLP